MQQDAGITSNSSRPDDPAEAEFRGRLAAKLAARGLPAADIPARVEGLLTSGVALRLDLAALLRPEESIEQESARPEG